MDRYVACFAIVAVVVIARMAYRAQFNLFTFVLGFGTLIFGAMVITGTVP